MNEVDVVDRMLIQVGVFTWLLWLCFDNTVMNDGCFPKGKARGRNVIEPAP